MTPDQMRDSKPSDFIAAWGKFMGSPDPEGHAKLMLKAYPPPADMLDPTFYTPEGEQIIWHRASDIKSERAMRAVKGYLYDRGIALPAEVSAAWAHVMERGQWAQNVRLAFEEVLAVHVEANDLLGTVDLMARVSQGLADRVE